MSQTQTKQHSEQRFLVSLPVRAEWDEEMTGRHVVVEGTTENVGPAGAIIQLQQLPAVGSHITISIQAASGPEVTAQAEVVRLVRDVRQPLVSLNVVNAMKEWRGRIWEPAGILASKPAETDSEMDQE
jgi:lysophospholipid acyltransferase (LPLAT)-like uncharacterized protein